MSVTVSKATLQIATGGPQGRVFISKATMQVASGPPPGNSVLISKATLQVFTIAQVATRRRQRMRF